MSIMEQVESISKDIHQKISEVKEGSDTQTFLLLKKKILDDSLQKIINEAQINKYEYELYYLFETCKSLQSKINMKERKSTEDDEDRKALQEAMGRMDWIRKTKLTGVKVTELPKNQVPV